MLLDYFFVSYVQCEYFQDEIATKEKQIKAVEAKVIE